MDWIGEIAEKIYGERWKRFTCADKDLAEEAIQWCVDHKEKLPSEVVFKTLWGAQLGKVISLSLEELYGSDLAYFMTKSRAREISETRDMVFKIYYENSGLPVLKMAGRFGFHHTTILHALKVHNDLYSTDKEYRKKFDTLNEKVKEKCENLLTSFGEYGSSEA